MVNRGFILIVLSLGFIVFASCDGRDNAKKNASSRTHSTMPTTQPTLRISLLDMTKTSPNLRPIVESAKLEIRRIKADVWPEPSSVAERQSHWEVSFDYRPQVVEAGGQQVIMTRDPSALLVRVQKSDLSAHVVPGR